MLKIFEKVFTSGIKKLCMLTRSIPVLEAKTAVLWIVSDYSNGVVTHEVYE